MPIDKSMLDTMLDSFRNMAKDCEDKGASGEKFDQMKAALERMEELGQEMGQRRHVSGGHIERKVINRRREISRGGIPGNGKHIGLPFQQLRHNGAANSGSASDHQNVFIAKIIHDTSSVEI